MLRITIYEKSDLKVINKAFKILLKVLGSTPVIVTVTVATEDIKIL